MARITVEEALEKVSTRYELIILAAKRARQLATGGRRPTLEWEDDKPTVMALREIEAGTVTTDNINDLKVDIADLEQDLVAKNSQIETMKEEISQSHNTNTEITRGNRLAQR